MIHSGAKLSLATLALEQIVVKHYDVRFPETLSGYIRALTEHPDALPEPLHVVPHPHYDGLFQLENGYHRLCAALMCGRREVVCVVEEAE